MLWLHTFYVFYTTRSLRHANFPFTPSSKSHPDLRITSLIPLLEIQSFLSIVILHRGLKCTHAHTGPKDSGWGEMLECRTCWSWACHAWRGQTSLTLLSCLPLLLLLSLGVSTIRCDGEVSYRTTKTKLFYRVKWHLCLETQILRLSFVALQKKKKYISIYIYTVYHLF